MFSNPDRYENARAHVKCRPEEAQWDAALQQKGNPNVLQKGKMKTEGRRLNLPEKYS